MNEKHFSRKQHPAFNGFAIVKSDTVDLPAPTRWIYVGVAGDVNVILANDTDAVLLKDVPVGMHELAVRRVMDTGTTATDLVGLY